MSRAALLAILTVVGLSGCGTVYDTCRMSPYGETFRVYGGVRQDAQEVHECTARAFGSPPGAGPWDIARAGLALADVPLSAAADTLLLPVTIPHARQSARREGAPPLPAGALSSGRADTPQAP